MKIRLKNDIILDLSVFRPDKAPVDLSEAENLKVILSSNGKDYTVPFTKDANRIIVYFTADLQEKGGWYTLTLTYNLPDVTVPEGKATYTVDYCDAFKLVSRSCDADIVPEDGIYTIPLTVTVDRIGGLGVDVEALIEKHNTSPESHADIRKSVSDSIIESEKLYVPKKGYLAYTQLEKDKLEGLQNYDDALIISSLAEIDTRLSGVDASLLEVNNSLSETNTLLVGVNTDQREIVVSKTFKNVADLQIWIESPLNNKKLRQGSVFHIESEESNFVADWDGSKYTAIPLLQKDAAKNLSNVSKEDFLSKSEETGIASVVYVTEAIQVAINDAWEGSY